jgi:hypothetical protein
MIPDIVTYLRRTAETCSRLARNCPHLETAHELEAIAADLMAKAHELEQQYG